MNNSGLQEFTFVLIDDKKDAMLDEIEEIKTHIASKNFTPVVETMEDGTEIQEMMANRHIDLIATDKNITDDVTGLDIINTISGTGASTDILLYSAFGIEDEDYKKAMQKHRFVHIVDTKNIAEDVKGIIDKLLEIYEDMSLMRGVVISQIIYLELSINSFLTKYFEIPPGKIDHFHNFVMENKLIPLEGKKQTLQKILQTKKIDKEFSDLMNNIEELQKDRNLLAHCRVDDADPKKLVSMGRTKTFDKPKIDKILKKIFQCINSLKQLEKEFTK